MNIFEPAVALLSRLKYPQKFTLISLLFALPLGLVLFMFISGIDQRIDFSKKETYGTQYIRPLRQLYQHALNDRLLQQQLSFGKTEKRTDLDANVAQIDKDFEALQVVDFRYAGHLGTTERLNGLKESWAAIKALGFDSKERAKAQQEFVAGIRGLFLHVADSSNLILDPDLDTYYTMDSALLKLPERQDLIVQTSLLGNSMVAGQSLTGVDRARLTVLSGLVAANNSATRQGLQTAYRNNPANNLKPALETISEEDAVATDEFLLTLTRDVVDAPMMVITSDQWYATTIGALDASFALWDAELGPLDSLLQTRISTFSNQKALALVVTFVMLLLVVYLWVGFYISVSRTVARMEQAARAMATGTMPTNMMTGNQDELGQVASAFNMMASTANQLTSAVNERTTELTEVAALLAHMKDGVVITDEQGMVKALNVAASRMLNTNFDNAVGRSLGELTRDLRLHETLKRSFTMPVQRQTVDILLAGHTVSVSVTAVPSAGGTMTGLVVMEDVTELRRLQRMYQTATAGVAR